MFPVKIKYFSSLTVGEYHHIVQAREKVFYLEQHVTCPDADNVDKNSVFIWMEDEGNVVAFLRLIPAGMVYDEVSIGRVMVDAGYRRRGLCRSLMARAVDFAKSEWGQSAIRISAQSYLCEFYASLGFEPVSDEYLEAGIPHIKMLKR